MVRYVMIDISGHFFPQMDCFFCIEKEGSGPDRMPDPGLQNTGLYDIVSKHLKLNPNFKNLCHVTKKPLNA